MLHINEVKRREHCYKFKDLYFSVWETHYKNEETGMTDIKYSTCPVIARGQGYDKFKCDGLNEFGNSCLLASGREETPTKLPENE